MNLIFYYTFFEYTFFEYNYTYKTAKAVKARKLKRLWQSEQKVLAGANITLVNERPMQRRYLT